MKRSTFLQSVAALLCLPFVGERKAEAKTIDNSHQIRGGDFPSDVRAVNAYNIGGLAIPKMYYRITDDGGIRYHEYSNDGETYYVSMVAYANTTYGGVMTDILFPMTIAQVKEVYTFPVAISSVVAAP